MTFNVQIDKNTWGLALLYIGPLPRVPILAKHSITLILFNLVVGVEW